MRVVARQPLSVILPFETYPTSDNSLIVRFTVPNKIEHACLAFTFACYSPLVSQGKVTISDLKVMKVPGATYDFSGFSAETHKNDKQNVKAFRLRLQVKRSGESGEVTLVVPTPSNGPSD